MNIDLSEKRVALVGGAGFIGHNLALELDRLGAEVHVFDSLQVNNLGAFTNAWGTPTGHLSAHMINERLELLRKADIPLHVVDARDYHVLGRSLSTVQPHVIVHLAAVAHANRANKDPYSTFDHSMRTLENALDSARGNVERFIFFSSSMVYGNFEEDSVTEESNCEPVGIYGALKFAGEKLVIAYNQVFDLPYTIIRPSALYGERCVSRRVGQIFIENAVRGDSITVNGNGGDRLDFTYIKDLVQGVIRCIAKKEAENQIFNVTYGSARSIMDMVDILKQRFPDLEVEFEPRDRLTPERGTLSVDKARDLLGYQPGYPLEKGFVGYMDWYQELALRDPSFLSRRSA